MRILRAADYRVMPWKNGGGTTTEIAVFPEGAGLDTFEWRVSMARVETDGPFSGFPGVDRTLAVLEGEGIVLDIEDREPVTLTNLSKPLSFPADVQTGATLVSGAIMDLNVMTRRGPWTHSVDRVALQQPFPIEAIGTTVLVLVAQGSARVGASGLDAILGAYDCAVLGPADESCSLEPQGTASIFVVRLKQG